MQLKIDKTSGKVWRIYGLQIKFSYVKKVSIRVIITYNL